MEWSFVPLHEFLDELKSVTDKHHAEISDEVLNIDWDTYDAASRAGQAVAVIARDKDKLAGYIIFTISRNLRFMHQIEAASSGWYIDPKYRGRLGYQIISKSDDFLKGAGVHKAEFTLDGLAGQLLKRNGYTTTHQVWEKKYGQ